jgi:hypothetical protein
VFELLAIDRGVERGVLPSVSDPKPARRLTEACSISPSDNTLPLSPLSTILCSLFRQSGRQEPPLS